MRGGIDGWCCVIPRCIFAQRREDDTREKTMCVMYAVPTGQGLSLTVGVVGGIVWVVKVF